MIELKNVCGGYDGVRQLSDVSLYIPAGCITAIIGPNGCGKSTLLKIIGGLKKPYNGDVLIGGISYEEMTPTTRAKTVSFLPQNRNSASIRVESLVLHGRFPYMGYPRRYREEDRAAARRAMEWAGVLPLRSRNVSTLSGGERQKVYIAMLLAQGTPIVLMDEPTSYLDISHKFEVIRMAEEMKKEGKTVVMVLHDLDLALRHSDQVALMEKGRIRICAPPEEAYRSGAIEEVFQVRAKRVETEEGVQYYFRPMQEPLKKHSSC